MRCGYPRPARLESALLGGLVLALAACGQEVPVYPGDAYGRDPAPIGALTGRILTTNSGDDTLSVVDPAAPAMPVRMPVGFSPVELEGPHHLAVDPGGRYVYVNLSYAVLGSGSGPHGSHGTGELPGHVVKIDTRTAREVGRVSVDPNAGDSVLSPDGKTLYVTHYDIIKWAHAAHDMDLRKADSRLAVIDTETMVVRRHVTMCPAAHGVRLSADGNKLFATCGPDEIAVVDLADTTAPARRVPLPGLSEQIVCLRCPYALTIAPDGTVWVSSLGPTGGRGGVDVFDPAAPGGGAFDPARSFTLRGAAMFATFGPAPAGAAPGAFRAWLPEQSPAADFIRVFQVDGPGAKAVEVDAIALRTSECVAPHMMLVTPDALRGHLICEGDHRGPGQFVWLDLPGATVLGSRPIGVFPDGLALVPPVQQP
jgi:hypothetical protein